ncbi:MAG: RCC1 repeat-containing protein, partial [Polyangiaceae bacterium]|nr:RCC1 repeat-containing protein [Polyangiaceae bacterium]
TGIVVCWGFNGGGRLGDGTTATRVVPTPVAGLTSPVSAIAAGTRHMCALSSTGAVVCWGDNSMGQLGDGTTVNRLLPTPVVGYP